MELDTLKAAWRERERQLDTLVAQNRRLVDTIERDHTRSDVRRANALPIFEIVCDVVAVLLVGSFVGDHLREPAMLWPALMLLAAAIATMIVGVRQLVAAAQIDYGAPVVTIQRDIARLAALRLAKARAMLTGAPLLWAPLFVVGAKGFFGVDVWQTFGVPFVVAQFAFGVAAIVAIVVLAPRFGGATIWQRVRDDIVGTNLAAARSRLDALGQFEQDA